MTTTPTTTLVARTRRIDPPADLLGELGDDGFAWLCDGAGFVTSGVVDRLAADDAVGVLAMIAGDDEVGQPGTGALAYGALPFAGDGDLVIPARVTGIAPDGTAWRTQISSVEERARPERRLGLPTCVRVETRPDRTTWRRGVAAALDEIAARRLEKVVLAREALIVVDAPFDATAVLDRLRATQPGCFVYGALHGGGGLVGASPELLVRRHGLRVASRPLAGTAVPGREQALLSSTKETREHRLVVDAVLEMLSPVCEELHAAEPEAVSFTSVVHLATAVTGRLRDVTPSALDLARALHPTPAVGGTPRLSALDLIRRLEGFDRGRYAGPVGWVDAGGDGEWAVALRGAELDGHRARLLAGAGIVAGSDPDAEWDEIDAKLEPTLALLGGAPTQLSR